MALTATVIDIDKHLNVQDKIRLLLANYGTQEIAITIDEIASKLRQRKPKIYQAVYRLTQNREIEPIKEPLANGREKIVGLRLIKLEPTGRTYQRAAERGKESIASIDRITKKDENPEMPHLVAYLNQKITIDQMRAKATEAGLDAEKVVQFEVNPFAEEGLLLLKHLSETNKTLEQIKNENQMLQFDLAAEKRNVEFLSRQKKEETQRDLAKMS